MAKIFPSKRRKVETPLVVPSVSLPVRRKERSLSSLVINTPRVSSQTGLRGQRTKAGARRALRGPSLPLKEPIKREDTSTEDHLDSSSSHETLNKIVQNRRQVTGCHWIVSSFNVNYYMMNGWSIPLSLRHSRLWAGLLLGWQVT